MIHRFDKGGIDPDLLMDECIVRIPGFKSGGHHEGIGRYLADENHGRISWDEHNIWVDVPDQITRAVIENVIKGLEG